MACSSLCRYQLFEEAGTDIGQLLTAKKTIAEKKSGMPLGLSKAIARISGGLYIVTATKGASRSAMVASWVAQVCTALSHTTVQCGVFWLGLYVPLGLSRHC